MGIGVGMPVRDDRGADSEMEVDARDIRSKMLGLTLNRCELVRKKWELRPLVFAWSLCRRVNIAGLTAVLERACLQGWPLADI